MDDLLCDFLTETNENLAELDVALVVLERTPDDANTLSLIFRMVHTIKGTCGFLGLPRLERVAHAAETVLGNIRDRTLAATPDVVSVVLTALDRIKAIVAGIAETGAEPAGDDTALIEALNATAAEELPADQPAAASCATRSADVPAVPAMTAVAEPSIPVMASPVPEPAAAAPAAAPAAAEAPHPEPSQADALEQLQPDWTGYNRSDHCFQSRSTHPHGAALPRSALGAAEPAAGTAGSRSAAQTIRVTVDVLDDLMTLVSELVLTRNQLLALARTQDNSNFTAPLQRLSHITSDLQEGVMKTRMQPIGHAWNKLPRIVRDLAQDMGKQIELAMIGAETELDRQVLELIKDPLTHMVRNSADHGLETPAERRAAGKPETGRITLNAFHEGGHIIIEIGDDGRGLALDRIRAKAVTNGLTTEAELAAMTDAQIARFIFRAGLSTAANVNAVSGRGVGMDVVKTNIERIGGTIDLKNAPGQGTTFIIRIPLTLAIVSALIVEAGNERFAIPQISVVELVRAQREGDRHGGQVGDSVIERINGTRLLRLRDRLLPLVSLNALLQIGEGEAVDSGAYIVVAQVGATLLGLIVDRVFDTEEIVVKPVAPILRHITMFSGNTILGDGSVIMILDPNGIARATGIGGGSENRMAAPAAAEIARSGERTAMLLFRVGGEQTMAVPLGLVARLEDIPREKIEISCGSPVIQYRGKLMPLVSMSGVIDETRERQPLLVFTDRERSMGLMVDEIVDVVEGQLTIELSGARAGMLGSAVIAGRTTDVLDTTYWLLQAWQDWFRLDPTTVRANRRRVLVVDDSAFFRELLLPPLTAAGFHVTTAAGAAEALRLRDGGAMFDAILSDIGMPGMNGLQFAQAVRAGGSWAHLPMIALSGRAEARDIAAGRNAGFTDYVVKFQREAVVGRLTQCLSDVIAA